MVAREQQYLEEMADQGYAEESIDLFHQVMIPHILEKFGVRKDDFLVEIGPAQGHCLISAYRAGYKNLGAIDYSDYKFPAFERSYGIRCHLVDIVKNQLPYQDSSVGAYLFFHTIEHITDAYLCVSEMLRTLKPGGTAIIVTPDWRKQYKTFYQDPTHVHPYDKTGLQRLLRMTGWKEMTPYSFGSKWGLGALGAFKYFPKLGMIGSDMMVVAKKV